jgi:hypothetical protein
MTTKKSSGRGYERMRIKAAEMDLKSCLFTLRDHFKVNWTKSSFKYLRYLVKMAKK